MLTFLAVALLGTILLDAGCRCAPGEGGARLLGGAVLAAGVLLAWLLVLATAGWLHQPVIWLGALLFWVGAWRRGRARGLQAVGARLSALAQRDGSGAFLVALTTLLLGWALWRPVFDVDAASYHLPYTAAALDAHALPEIDTPFGDPAAAYQPKNDDLLRVALAPFGDERLVWIGAFPHLPLLLLAIYVAARACGCRRRTALVGAASALVAEFVVRQAATAMVDLPFAAWWCAFAAASLRGHALVAGLGLGLAYGTKFLAVPFTPLAAPFVALLLARHARGTRWRAAATFAVGLGATGAFFYVRNLIVTGNPIHPIRIDLLGLRLIDGLYGREEMAAWKFHFTGRVGVGLTLVHLAWPQLGIRAWWPVDFVRAAWFAGGLWVLGLLASIRRLPALVCALLVPAVFATVMFVVPYNDARFVLVAVAMQGVAVARLAHVLGRAWRIVRLAVLFQIGLGHWPTGLPLGEQPLCWAVPAAVLLALALRAAPRVTVALFAIGLLAVAAFAPAPRWLGPPGDEQREAWQHLLASPDRDVIAYAGTNVPYPLRGRQRRRVLYVPPDGRTDLRFHDHARAWVRDGLPLPIVPEPNLQRRFQEPKAWVAALRREQVRWLYVGRLHAQQLLTVRHDGRGYPIEAGWARALPSVFEPVLSVASTTLLFRVVDREPTEPMPAATEQRECDALQLLAQPADLALFYPLAAAELQDPDYARLVALAKRR